MSRIYTATESMQMFCRQMNTKARQIGMRHSLFNDPAGIDNRSTAADMMRCLLAASGYERLYDIWNCDDYTIHVQGQNQREIAVTSTVTADGDSFLLQNYYPIMGGKTGTITRKGVFNLVAIVAVPETDDWLICSVLHAEQGNGYPSNRFAATKQAIDAALIKYYDQDADNSKIEVCASGVAVCKKPKHNPRAYAQRDIPLLFEKNAFEEKLPASTTKILTAMVVLDYIPDFYTKLTITEEDIEAMPPRVYNGDLKPGDIITVRDALFAMFLPSSNAAAYALSRFVGQIIAESRYSDN